MMAITTLHTLLPTKTRWHLTPASVLFLSLFSVQAQAVDTGESAETNSSDWAGELSLSISSMAGNVETKSASLGLKLDKETLPWRYHVAAQGSASEVADTRIAEQYLADLQADYVLPSKNYWFGYAGYDSNKFASIDKRFAEIVGYGMNVIDSPQQKLGMEVGMGARQSTFTDDLGRDNETIGHLGVEYSLQLTDNTQLTENFVVQPGAENTFTLSDTSLEVGMSKKTSIKLTYGYTHNSKVFPDTKKTDTSTNVSFVVGF